MAERDAATVEMEYKEATNAYFQGVNAGVEWSKGIVTVQSLLFTAYALSSTWNDQGFKPSIALIPICIFGALTAGVYISLMPHYRRLLRACQDRCIEIEKEFDGNLFHKIGGVRPTQRDWHATGGLAAIGAAMVMVWGGLLVTTLFFLQHTP